MAKRSSARRRRSWSRTSARCSIGCSCSAPESHRTTAASISAYSRRAILPMSCASRGGCSVAISRVTHRSSIAAAASFASSAIRPSSTRPTESFLAPRRTPFAWNRSPLGCSSSDAIDRRSVPSTFGAWRRGILEGNGEADALMATVLLIDDTPEVTAELDAFFDRAGHRVVRVHSGGDGIEAYQRTRPDLVLLDLRLPDMSGFDVLERIRVDAPVVIIVTAHSDIPLAVQALQRGAEHILTTPVDLDHLRVATGRGWEKARQRQ